MSEIQAMFDRQARWQKSRRMLSWPEKIRMAERIRESVQQLRRGKEPVPASGVDGPHVAGGTCREAGNQRT